MAIETTKLTAWWCIRSRKGVQTIVDTFRVAQGHIVPFLREDVFAANKCLRSQRPEKPVWDCNDTKLE
jgi:hypothetical protein